MVKDSQMAAVKKGVFQRQGREKIKEKQGEAAAPETKKTRDRERAQALYEKESPIVKLPSKAIYQDPSP